MSDTRRPDGLVDRLAAAVADDGKEEVVNAYDEFEEHVKRSARAEMLLKLLRSRFGPVPEAIAARVSEADSAQLDVWAERMLTAQTLADTFGGRS